MNYSSQSSGVKRGAARVRHNRLSEGVTEFLRLKDVREVWFLDIFSLKILTVADTAGERSQITSSSIFDSSVSP